MPSGLGSVQTVTLKGGIAAARRVTSRLRLFSHLVNVGEARSLVAHPATTTHRNVDPATRAHLGIGDGTLRISVGIEEPDDLIADWEQGCRPDQPDGMATRLSSPAVRRTGKGIQSCGKRGLDSLPLRFAPAGNDKGAALSA